MRMRYRSAFVGLILTLLFGLTLVACSGSTEGLVGQELYEKSCAHCHGSAGEGTGAGTPLDASSPSVDLTDEQVRGAIEVGPGAMPGYSRFTPEQLDSLVVFIRELQGAGS